MLPGGRHTRPVRTYLDHASTTPMVPAAVEAMAAVRERVGNPSSLHGSGRAARTVLEDAREVIAGCLGAQPYEVIFTSGGTESDNLAVKGAFWSSPRPGVVTSATEHHAVLDATDWLGRAQGAEVGLVPVDPAGRVEPADLASAITERTAVVSLHWGNNEVGTLQPVAQAAELARARGATSHSDAVQAVGHVEVDFAASGLDLLSCTAHKLGGPVGVGALLARRSAQLVPVLHGGGQERDLRSGTLNAVAAAGFAAALRVAVQDRPAEEVRVRRLRAELLAAVSAVVPDAVPNGGDDGLPGIVSVCFPGCPADALLLTLDAAGIDCSAGSACSAGVAAPSHVLLAMGRTPAEARCTLRFSLGHSSTAADLAVLAAALPEAVGRARAAGALSG